MLYMEKLTKILDGLPYQEKIAMAKSSCTMRAIWLKLAGDKDGQIKIALAHQREIDVEILDMLVADSSPNVRYALINGTSTDHIPAEYLEKLAEDQEEFIKDRAKEILAQRFEKEGISFFFYCAVK